MSLTDRLFGRPAGVKLDLAAVQAWFADAVRHTGEPDPDLTRARLADRLRDAGLTPLLPEEIDTAAAGLDGEGWRRLAVLVSALDHEPVRTAVAQHVGTWPLPQFVAMGFTDLARETHLLTIEVLGQSELRVEELARRFLAAIRAAVAGETAEESRKKLHRLDYARLLEEAEQAKASATDRAERLRRLREEQERRTRRGKW